MTRPQQGLVGRPPLSATPPARPPWTSGKREGAGTGKTHDSQDEAMQALFKSAYEGLKQLDLPDWAVLQVDDTTAQFDALTGDNIGQQAATLATRPPAPVSPTRSSIDRLIKVFPDFSSATQDSVYAVSQAIGGMDSSTLPTPPLRAELHTGGERQKLASDDPQKQFKGPGRDHAQDAQEFRKMVSAALDARTERRPCRSSVEDGRRGGPCCRRGRLPSATNSRV